MVNKSGQLDSKPMSYLLKLPYKGDLLYTEQCYTTLEKDYMIHTFS